MNWTGLVAAAVAAVALMPTPAATASPAAPPDVPKCFGRTATILATDSYAVTGTPRDDVIIVSGDHHVDGAGGDDRICGAQSAGGGPGNDRIRYYGDEDHHGYADGGPGRDLLIVGGPAYVYGGPGNDVIKGRAGQQNVFGRTGNDVITGGPGQDFLRAGPGADVVRGQGGQDLIWGGSGPDRLNGGPGPDSLDGELGRDVGRGGAGDDLCGKSTERRISCPLSR